MHEQDDDQFEDLGPSKSQIKREMHALQEMGKRICELPKKQLAVLPISETMREAVAEWDRISKNEAKRRHLQYVGKVMRTEDADAIQEALDLLDPSSDAFNRILHQQEKWRDRLISEGNEALTQFVDAFPATDMQHLRQLIRNAAKEKQDIEAGKAKQSSGKSASRKLFLYIKSVY